MYIILTDQNFEKEILQKTTSILVEFGAGWCGGCHIYEPMYEKLLKKNKGNLKIGKIDIDKNKKLKEQYGIQKIPTLLFIKQGKIIDHYVGVMPKELLFEKANRLICD